MGYLGAAVGVSVPWDTEAILGCYNPEDGCVVCTLNSSQLSQDPQGAAVALPCRHVVCEGCFNNIQERLNLQNKCPLCDGAFHVTIDNKLASQHNSNMILARKHWFKSGYRVIKEADVRNLNSNEGSQIDRRYALEQAVMKSQRDLFETPRYQLIYADDFVNKYTGHDRTGDFQLTQEEFNKTLYSPVVQGKLFKRLVIKQDVISIIISLVAALVLVSVRFC